MSAGTFKQNGLGWQVDLLRQRVDEYIEFKVSQLSLDIPELGFLKSEVFWQIVRVILWSITAILLAWISWRIWLLLRFYLKRWKKQKQQNHLAVTMVTSKISVAEWVNRGQEYGKQGDYRQGIFCLYQAMLHLLDDRALIKQQSSLTDREYQQSLQKLQLSQLQTYELLLAIHQRLCFSSAKASKSLFDRCLQAYQSIETQ